jgi:protein SCO1/2
VRAFAKTFLSVLLLASSVHTAIAGDALKAGVFDPPREAPGFRLQGSDGSELTPAALRGKVWILQFGFASCPDVCPTTLAVLAKAQRRIAEEGGEPFRLVYLTVDPEHDDAARLKAYLAHYDPSFVGGTGTPEQMAAVRSAYGIAAEKTAKGISHSSFTYLVDREGRLRALMPFGSTPEDYVHDVRLLQKK